VLLLATLGAAVFYGLIAPKMMAMANHPAPAALSGIASLCFSLLHQAGIVLLLLAAFAGRQPQTPPPLR